MVDRDGPRSFNDFTKIKIGKRMLSSATVSKRIDRLLAVKVIEEIVTRSKTGRRVIEYRITEKGKRVLNIANELEKALDVSKANDGMPMA